MTLIGVVRNTILADLPGLSQWIRKAFWAVAEVGLFSFSNFSLNLLLARWLPPSSYGAFTIGFSIFILLGTFHLGLVSEPMLVFGADRKRHPLPEYLENVLFGHIGFVTVAAVLCFLLGLGLWFAGPSALYPTLFSLGFAVPCILLLSFMRTASYLHLATHFAAASGLLYLILMVAGAYAFQMWNWLSPVSAIGVMGVSSLAAGLWLAARLKQRLPRLREGKAIYDVMSRHWQFGRWMIGYHLLLWFMTNIWYILLPVWGGLVSSGAFRALVIFLIPPSFTLYALARLVIGALVRTRGTPKFLQIVRVMLVGYIVVSTLYWVLLGKFGESLMIWLYGGQYREYHVILWLLGSIVALEAATSVLNVALQSLQRPDLVFRARLFSVVVVCVVGVPLALTFGIWGAAAGYALAHMMSAASMGVLVGRAGRIGDVQTPAVAFTVQPFQPM